MSENPGVWRHPHLLGLSPLTADELHFVLETADGFAEVSLRSVKKLPVLRGRVVVNAFFEDSTRTRISFTLAAQRLGADVVDFSAKGSSVSKGESLVDTVRNLEAMGVDVMVVRHPSAGAADLVARSVGCSVVNAGDGGHEHPTQGLLDVYTVRKHFGRVDGLAVVIVGDIANSRVARSNVHALTKLGAKVTLVGPATLLPNAFAKLPGVRITTDLDAALDGADVVNMLRIQFERMKSAAFPTVREYAGMFGLTSARLARCGPDTLVMHPGPMNRGVEIDGAVADAPQSRILDQVANGLAVRMAVLYLCDRARLA